MNAIDGFLELVAVGHYGDERKTFVTYMSRIFETTNTVAISNLLAATCYSHTFTVIQCVILHSSDEYPGRLFFLFFK